jgi:hypothetical protein
MWLADTNFPWEKNFEVENFQLLTMIFSENFLSVEIFLDRVEMDLYDELSYKSILIRHKSWVATVLQD